MKRAFLLTFLLNVFSFGLFAQTSLIKKTVLGGEGGWDYLSVSAEERRLYLSHGNQVEVLNIDSHEKIAVIPDTKGVHGIIAVPALGKGFITAGKTNSLIVFDLKTFAKLAELPTGENPDALLYDQSTGRIFVFNHTGGSVTAVDANSLKVIRTFKLGGSAAEAGVSNKKGTIYVNLEDLNEIVAFDAKTLMIKSRWKVAPGEEPTGLAIDLTNERLFSVCGNNKMIILNAKNGKVVTEAPIGSRCDGVVFDPVLKTAFSSNGEGTISVIQEVSPNKFSVKETIKSATGARTIDYDPVTHHVFTVTAQYGETPAPTTENPHPRPKVIPGTFTVLEFGK